MRIEKRKSGTVHANKTLGELSCVTTFLETMYHVYCRYWHGDPD